MNCVSVCATQNKKTNKQTQEYIHRIKDDQIEFYSKKIIVRHQNNLIITINQKFHNHYTHHTHTEERHTVHSSLY